MRPVVAAALLAALAAAVPAGAQQGLRDSDRPYRADELSSMLEGHAVEFYDGSVSRYRADGAYSYKYTDNDRPHLGRYEVFDGGRVCIDFRRGSRRCDIFVSDGDRMVLIIADGTRFPVRDRRRLVDDY